MRYYSIPTHIQRILHRLRSFVALCPSENLDGALVLITLNSKAKAAILFQGPHFQKSRAHLVPFDNFRSITVSSITSAKGDPTQIYGNSAVLLHSSLVFITVRLILI